MKTRLTLSPGMNGTKKLVGRYGDRLVCVRYRYDEKRNKRIKTVELIEDEAPWQCPQEIYLVKIAYQETELREAIKQSGGRWNAQTKVWECDARVVKKLSLEPRVIGTLARE